MSGGTVPSWVLTEVGRLHLHNLALEDEIAQLHARLDDHPTASAPDEEEAAGFSPVPPSAATHQQPAPAQATMPAVPCDDRRGSE